MEHKALRLMTIMVPLIFAAQAAAVAQGIFKFPHPFDAGGKKLPAGAYWIGTMDDGRLVLRQEEKSVEIVLPVLKRMPQPAPPLAEPQVVLAAVGNFEPSYTEYVTDYILSEVWFPGQDGFIIRSFKGAHQSQTIPAEKPAS